LGGSKKKKVSKSDKRNKLSDETEEQCKENELDKRRTYIITFW